MSTGTSYDAATSRVEFAVKEVCRDDLRDALSVRVLQSAGVSQQTIDKHVSPERQRSTFVREWMSAPLSEIADRCLAIDGHRHEDIMRMPRDQRAMLAMGFAPYGRSGGAYHTSASFPYLVADAANKSMTTGYTQARSTWRGPMRQAESVQDFKTIHRVTIGAVPNIPVWNDNLPPEKASMADSEETYAVECHSYQIDFSYKLIVNDDMRALTRGPQLLGDAMARTVNVHAWASVTANPTMGDGQTLFLETPTGNRKQSNYTTGSATPVQATLADMKKKMRLIAGQNTPEGNQGDDILNIEPRYLVVPAAHEETAAKAILSGSDPAVANNTAYNTARTLQLVVEPVLDSNSAYAWYLFASTNQIDTAEVTFLQGQEEPQVRTWTSEETLSMKLAILQTFAARAINWRGIHKHAGQ